MLVHNFEKLGNQQNILNWASARNKILGTWQVIASYQICKQDIESIGHRSMSSLTLIYTFEGAQTIFQKPGL